MENKKLVGKTIIVVITVLLTLVIINLLVFGGIRLYNNIQDSVAAAENKKESTSIVDYAEVIRERNKLATPTPTPLP